MRIAGLAVLLVALLVPAAALAHEEDAKALRRVSFQVERSREVDNDWLRASVVAQAEDADAAAVADRVNQAMSWALARAKAVPGLKLHSTGYQTWPIQEAGRIRRWQASQQLLIEGADVAAITKLLGELQSKLQLGSLEFTLSPERRRAVEEELSVEVLKAFRAKADLVADTLGAGNYQIVRVDLDGGGMVPMYRDMPMAANEISARSVAPPSAEGGRSQVSVRAGATIELD